MNANLKAVLESQNKTAIEAGAPAPAEGFVWVGSDPTEYDNVDYVDTFQNQVDLTPHGTQIFYLTKLEDWK
ncbi:MAG TPA: hypothetical protein DCL21_05075 [Alphaproteobacteria bacterium]|nr:hypothetical protein [Alphaproteobacteria bacterium]